MRQGISFIACIGLATSALLNPVAAAEPPAKNAVRPTETASGWTSLFDGKTLAGWHKFGGGPPGTGWTVADGELRLAAGSQSGDIVTDASYSDFELELDWNIASGGNSGVFYHVDETAKRIWHLAPEIQLLDNERAEDRNPQSHRAGSLYDLFAATDGVARPAGTYNQLRVVVRGSRIEHWLNGQKVVAYDTSQPDWKKVVAASKFAAYPGFATATGGHIGLQDHGDAVRFRNIRIRPL